MTDSDAGPQQGQTGEKGRQDGLIGTPADAGEMTVSNPAPATDAGIGPGIGPGTKPDSAPGPSFPATRPPYIPQFSAATQMILKRISGEPSSLSAALSQVTRSPAVTSAIPSATYEDVKRRLVSGMNTSSQMTMHMPAPPPPPRSPSTALAPKMAQVKSTGSTAGMSAIRKVTAGLTASSRPTPVKPAAAATVVASEIRVKKTKTVAVQRGPGAKRKRAKSQGDGDDDDIASTSSGITSDSEPRETPQSHVAPAPAPSPLTTTKSGRQVLKPTAYNPAAIEAASKKRPHHYGKRTTEQALCKKCTRMYSPASNQMVFCDGCNDGWHQLCHDPWIADDVVRDEQRAWFCGTCQAKRERAHPSPAGGVAAGASKRPKLDHPRQKQEHAARESWAGRPPQQKRAYLLTLPQQELVGLLMRCLELHPDLPIFPAAPSSLPPPSGGDHHGQRQHSHPHLPHDHHHQQQQKQQNGTVPRSLLAGTTTDGLFPRADAHPNGPINYVRKVTAGGGGASANSGSGKGRSGAGGRGSQKEDSTERTNEEEDEDQSDPLVALWPRPGMGLYRLLPPDTEDGERLVDENDFEAFSVIVYDDRGRKVQENGMRV